MGPHELKLHNEIITQRSKRAAHTDETKSGRDIVDVFGSHTYSEEYPVIDRESLGKIASLAEALRDGLATATKKSNTSLAGRSTRGMSISVTISYDALITLTKETRQ